MEETSWVKCLAQGYKCDPLRIDLLATWIHEQINASLQLEWDTQIHSHMWAQTDPKTTGGDLAGQRSTRFSYKPIYSAQAHINMILHFFYEKDKEGRDDLGRVILSARARVSKEAPSSCFLSLSLSLTHTFSPSQTFILCLRSALWRAQEIPLKWNTHPMGRISAETYT